MPSNEGVLEGIIKQYDNYRGRLSVEDSYQVTAYIFSQYSSPLDFPTLQLGFFQK
jgi:hypothetical protein